MWLTKMAKVTATRLKSIICNKIIEINFSSWSYIEWGSITVIYTGFLDCGPPNARESVYWGCGRYFLIGRSPEMWGNFPKFALKLLNNWKIIEKTLEKMQMFTENFSFFARGVGNLLSTQMVYWGFGFSPSKLEKFSMIISKNLNCKISKFKIFSKICLRFLTKLFKNTRIL